MKNKEVQTIINNTNKEVEMNAEKEMEKNEEFLEVDETGDEIKDENVTEEVKKEEEKSKKAIRINWGLLGKKVLKAGKVLGLVAGGMAAGVIIGKLAGGDEENQETPLIEGGNDAYPPTYDEDVYVESETVES